MPVALREFVFRKLERSEPLHELRLKNVPRAVKGVAREPDQLVFGEPQGAGMIEQETHSVRL